MCWNYEVPKRQWHAWDWYFQASRVFIVLNGFEFWGEKITSFRDRNSTKESQTDYIWRWGNSLEEKILGDSTLQSLLDTMLYMNGLYLTLHGEKEYGNLQYWPSQIHLTEKPGERPYLMYVEEVLKNHPGGLKGRKIKPKIAYHHANTKRPERRFIRFYKLYNSQYPADCPNHAYYLKPLQNQRMSVGIQINQ